MTISRRDFLKACCAGAAALGTVSCATAKPQGYKNTGPILPPSKGCFVGMQSIGLESYALDGIVPKIVAPQVFHFLHQYDYPAVFVDNASKYGAIPFIHRTPTPDIQKYSALGMLKSKDWEDDVKRYADKITKCGKRILFTTLFEINDEYTGRREWKRNDPNWSKDVWRSFFEICKAQGANDYMSYIVTMIPA